jgi:hypothetical protein
MNMKKKLISFFFVFLFSLVLVSPVLAFSGADPLGVNVVNSTTALSNEDPRRITIRIINVVLGFLGIITIVVIIVGGFKWMTSGGNQEKVTASKKLLISGLVGLAIVLLSWGIAAFVINQIGETTIVQYSGG